MSEVQKIVDGQKAPIGFFRKSANRKETVQYLVEVLLNRKNQDVLIPLTVQDFKKFNLYSFLVTYYKGSVRKAHREAYSSLFNENNKDDPNTIILELILKNISPPRGFWCNETNKKKTLFHLLNESKISPYEIKASDFKKYNLSGFLIHYFDNSPYKAMEFYNPDLKPFLFYRVNPDIWQNEKMRKEALIFYFNLLKNQKINKKNLLKIGFKSSLLEFYQYDIGQIIAEYQHFK